MRSYSRYIQKSCPEFVNQNQISSTYNDDPDENKGTHYVMWSGGTDSTLLLYELLDAYGAENVVAVSYKYPWLLENKYESERIHREAFKAKMNLRGEKYSNFTHVEFDIKQNVVSGSRSVLNVSPCCGLPQAIAWLLSISLYSPYHSYIYDGGIREDDLTIILDSYHKTFEGISEVLDKKFILREPYIMFSKRQVLERIFKYDLYEETWHCEMPGSINDECLTCNPCKTHIAALNEISLFCKDEMIKMKAAKVFSDITNKYGERKRDNNDKECIDLRG